MKFYDTKTEFLRFQVRRTVIRSEWGPVYEDPIKLRGRILDFKTTGKKIDVEHLIGFGPTEKAAAKMAMEHLNLR